MNVLKLLIAISAIVLAVSTIIIITSKKHKKKTEGYELTSSKPGTGAFKFQSDLELRGDARYFVKAGDSSYAPIDDPKYGSGVLIGRCLSGDDKLVYKSTLEQHAQRTSHNAQAELLQLQADDMRADVMLEEINNVKRQIADKIGALRIVSKGPSNYLESQFAEFGDPICVRPDGRVYSAELQPGGTATADKAVVKDYSVRGKRESPAPQIFN